MNYNPDVHKRKSIRLKEYDYSRNGLYFVTISVKDKLCLFGKVENDTMSLGNGGKLVENIWKELEKKFDNSILHDYIVMPNHFHGIIEISNPHVGADLCVCPDGQLNVSCCVCKPGGTHRFTPTNGKFIHNKQSLSSMIQWFKTMTTNAYITGVNSNCVKPFNKKLWQRNYHEHIIRNQESFIKISDYIQNNPTKWKEDIFYNDEI